MGGARPPSTLSRPNLMGGGNEGTAHLGKQGNLATRAQTLPEGWVWIARLVLHGQLDALTRPSPSLSLGR